MVVLVMPLTRWRRLPSSAVASRNCAEMLAAAAVGGGVGGYRPRQVGLLGDAAVVVVLAVSGLPNTVCSRCVGG